MPWTVSTIKASQVSSFEKDRLYELEVFAAFNFCEAPLTNSYNSSNSECILCFYVQTIGKVAQKSILPGIALRCADGCTLSKQTHGLQSHQPSGQWLLRSAWLEQYRVSMLTCEVQCSNSMHNNVFSGTVIYCLYDRVSRFWPVLSVFDNTPEACFLWLQGCRAKLSCPVAPSLRGEALEKVSCPGTTCS